MLLRQQPLRHSFPLLVKRLPPPLPTGRRPFFTGHEPPYKPGTPPNMVAAKASERYRGFSRQQLLERIASLEQACQSSSAAADATDADVGPKRKTNPRPFDINRYPCRKIALRFSYDGEAYRGLEMQSVAATAAGSVYEGEAVPTVESVLWKALCDARLVDETSGLAGVGWSRCGRTDRGVSAAGQVVALWIRSRKVDEWPQRRAFDKLHDEAQSHQEGDAEADADDEAGMPTFLERRLQKETRIQQLVQLEAESATTTAADEVDNRIAADPNAEEMPYVMAINRLLPPSIRIQAWSPVSPAFNARFDCRYRHYKYFFTSGAPFVKQSLVHGPVPRLDIKLMRRAAQRFLGEHDFRNFCKIDPSKAINNFYRRIDGISIDRVGRRWTQGPEQDDGDDDDSSDTEVEHMYVLNLRGTAFLYHQVRHIVAVLFLVGSGLEKPSIVDELLNVTPGGVYCDRILSNKLNQLRLCDDDTPAALQAVLPPTSDAAVTDASGGLVEHYHRLRLETSSWDADRAGLSREDGELLAPLRELFVFDRRPIYEMAMDRPLMLWDCGFEESDIQWRASSFDGPMNAEVATTTTSPTTNASTDTPTPYTRAMLYSIWNAHAISTELYRHFALALPRDSGASRHDDSTTTAEYYGYIPASTAFQDARHPSMSFSAETASTNDASSNDTPLSSRSRVLVPLGYGRFKSALSYVPLRDAPRMATPTEKYEKFSSSRGLRKAERRAAAAASAAIEVGTNGGETQHD